MRIKLDENLGRPHVILLKRHGYEADRVFDQGLSGIEDADLWVSARATVHDVWAPPVNLGPSVNSVFNDSFPSLSSDGQTLFFNSTRNRPGSPGGFDLYVSTRFRLKPLH